MSNSNSRSWINNPHRHHDDYKQGVLEFVEFVKNHSPPDAKCCICPCKRCRNCKSQLIVDVPKHLIVYGMEEDYVVWYLHGERTDHDVVNPTSSVSNQDQLTDRLPEEHQVDGALGNLVDDVYRVHENIDPIGGNIGEKYHEYKRMASEKLYPSCEDRLTTLSAIIELHNLKKEFNWSGNSVTELLKLLKRWLPKENKLPDKYSMMKKMIKDLGMNVKCIHACENDCVLFWKENEDALECPRCGTPRFQVKKKGKIIEVTKQPNKVLKYFPIIPRLTRLYTIPSIARNMLWHSKAKPNWDFMRHPIDSAEWRSIQYKWPMFASDERNIWLGIATDGFNPNSVLSNSYSCWPVYIFPYNLPPSLCMNEEFQMMCLLIPGPKAPSQDIDVYLEPLVDELKKLWFEGVPAFDMDKKEHFTLKAMLLWGIHDLPALGNLSGCVTHGYNACPVCATETESERVNNKIVYTQYRRFLKKDHPYRRLRHGWYKDIEDNEPPLRLTGQLLLQKLDRIKYVPGKVKKKKKRAKDDVDCDEEEYTATQDDSEERPAWYKKSILFDLEYWSGHKVRHTIDVMHTEKNVAEHFVNFLFEKNKQSSKFSFDKNHKMKCCQVLVDTKFPSYFRTRFSNLVNVNSLSLNIKKSYDFHVFIQHLLPIMVQHAYPKNRELRRAILQVCLYFNIICSKVLVREHVQAAKYMIGEALCVLAHYLPAYFFDISIHTMVHLADQAILCGPVNYTWMYPFERAMKECKNLPSNKRYVEGSISESYLVKESVRYAMEYMPNPCRSAQASFLNENDNDVSEHSIVEGKKIKLSSVQRTQIRRWILFRIDIPDRDDYYSEYRSLVESSQQSKKRPHTKTEVVSQTEFIDWLQKKLIGEKEKSMLWFYVNGPGWEAKTHMKYSVNGYVFSPQYYDATHTTQDSGVCMDAITTFIASTKDLNPVDDDTTWYGIIKEIVEVDYHEFQHVVFYCDWINIADKTNGCKICPESQLMTVNLKKIKSNNGEYDEPAILASEASQVFYIQDTHNPDWSIVRRSPKHMTDSVDDYELSTDFQSVLKEQPNLKTLLTCIGCTI